MSQENDHTHDTPAAHNCILFTLNAGLTICKICGTVKPEHKKLNSVQPIHNPIVAHWLNDYEIAS